MYHTKHQLQAQSWGPNWTKAYPTLPKWDPLPQIKWKSKTFQRVTQKNCSIIKKDFLIPYFTAHFIEVTHLSSIVKYLQFQQTSQDYWEIVSRKWKQIYASVMVPWFWLKAVKRSSGFPSSVTNIRLEENVTTVAMYGTLQWSMIHYGYQLMQPKYHESKATKKRSKVNPMWPAHSSSPNRFDLAHGQWAH